MATPAGDRIEEGVDAARRALELLPELEIDLNALTQRLEDEGVAKFVEPFDSLMTTLKEAADKAAA